MRAQRTRLGAQQGARAPSTFWVRERERRTQFCRSAGARAAHPKFERLQDSVWENGHPFYTSFNHTTFVLFVCFSTVWHMSLGYHYHHYDPYCSENHVKSRRLVIRWCHHFTQKTKQFDFNFNPKDISSPIKPDFQISVDFQWVCHYSKVKWKSSYRLVSSSNLRRVIWKWLVSQRICRDFWPAGIDGWLCLV